MLPAGESRHMTARSSAALGLVSMHRHACTLRCVLHACPLHWRTFSPYLASSAAQDSPPIPLPITTTSAVRDLASPVSGGVVGAAVAGAEACKLVALPVVRMAPKRPCLLLLGRTPPPNDRRRCSIRPGQSCGGAKTGQTLSGTASVSSCCRRMLGPHSLVPHRVGPNNKCQALFGAVVAEAGLLEHHASLELSACANFTVR